jgi:hypothetical protein
MRYRLEKGIDRLWKEQVLHKVKKSAKMREIKSGKSRRRLCVVRLHRVRLSKTWNAA